VPQLLDTVFELGVQVDGAATAVQPLVSSVVDVTLPGHVTVVVVFLVPVKPVPQLLDTVFELAVHVAGAAEQPLVS
jgi:hypothetical protein